MRPFRFPSPSALPLALLVVAIACATQPTRASAPSLEVFDPWVRSAPPGAPALAGYALLRNHSDLAIVVATCETAGFASVSLHETRYDPDGVARMRELERIVVPAGGAVALAPGGMHLMLMAPSSRLVEGDEVALCVRVDGADRDVLFDVRRAPPEPANSSHQH